QVDHSPFDSMGSSTGFDLQIGGISPALIAAGAPVSAAPWRLAGGDGSDQIEAALAPAEVAAAGAAFGLHLDLESSKPPALHDGDGFVDFGAGGSSYYYSRTRMTATGTLQLNGEQLSVDGIAWFDHQWGDFVSVGGGWNWFAVNLDDGTDLTFSVVFDAEGNDAFAYGTVVEPDGSARHIEAGAFGIRATDEWASPRGDRVYPTHWFITVPDFRGGRQLLIELTPTVDDQELDARATTGVIYWEGSQHVRATIGQLDATTQDGQAYVELTRYGP
ncbi:MAG TPA: lipocalin family protein, partial [Patescibacteria group bacterium]|nr:lipocalin family protein [Patescibacteria group bacterium]